MTIITPTVFCPECRRLGWESVVSLGLTEVRTLSPYSYYDTQGNYHNHDCTETWVDYKCSLGHEWQESQENYPPQWSCGCQPIWGAELETKEPKVEGTIA